MTAALKKAQTDTIIYVFKLHQQLSEKSREEKSTKYENLNMMFPVV